MKILFLNPPSKRGIYQSSIFPPFIDWDHHPYPIFLASAAGVSQTVGFESKLLDAVSMNLNYSSLFRIIERENPGLCVIDIGMANFNQELEFCAKIKKELDCPVCMAGQFASAIPEELLEYRDSVDFVALGEYEYTVCDIGRVLSKNKKPLEGEINAIAGIAFNAAKSIRRTQNRRAIENLDSLPFASRVYAKHLKDSIGRYAYDGVLHPCISIVAGRGCPFSCVYCSYNQVFMGNRFRLRSISNIVDEMEFISNVFPNVKEIVIEDCTLTKNKDRCYHLSSEIQRRGLEISWVTNTRPDLDLDTLKVMGAAGLRMVYVKYDSGNQRILDNLGKKLSLEQMRVFTRNAKKAGIQVFGYFFTGGEGENIQSLADTAAYSKTLNADSLRFIPVPAYPGTLAYQKAFSKGFIPEVQHGSPEKVLGSMVLSTPDLPREKLLKFCKDMQKNYYSDVKVILKKAVRILLNPKEITRALRKGRRKVNKIKEKNP